MLIFSQMVRMLDVLDEYCTAKRYACERLDGRTTGKARQKVSSSNERKKLELKQLLSIIDGFHICFD